MSFFKHFWVIPRVTIRVYMLYATLLAYDLITYLYKVFDKQNQYESLRIPPEMLSNINLHSLLTC